MRREYLRHAPWTNAIPLVVLWRTAAAACATAANEAANAAHIMRLQPPVLAAPNHFGSLVIYKHVKQRLSATVRSPGTAALTAVHSKLCSAAADSAGRQRAGTRSGGCASVRASACEHSTAQHGTAQRCGTVARRVHAWLRAAPRPSTGWPGPMSLSLHREPTHSLTRVGAGTMRAERG